MDRDARSYLWDIKDASDAIGRFTSGLNSGTFAENEVVQAAVGKPQLHPPPPNFGRGRTGL